MDKCSCENCAKFTQLPCSGRCYRWNAWQRDPTKWLSILPTEPGHYWWRKNDTTEAGLDYLDKQDIEDRTYTMQGDEWQGPIAPRN